jgi:hypothetical protein
MDCLISQCGERPMASAAVLRRVRNPSSIFTPIVVLAIT